MNIRSWTAVGRSAVLLHVATVMGLLLFAIPQSVLAETNHTGGLTPNVEEFLDLLGKNDVQDWLRARQQASGGAEIRKELPSDGSFGKALSERLMAIRVHLNALWQVVPRMNAEVETATRRLRIASGGAGFITIFATAGVLVGSGLAALFLVKSRLSTGYPGDEGEGEASPAHRRRVMGLSLVQEVAGVIAFCVACFGPLLFYERAPLADPILLTLLAAVTAWMLLRGALRVLFSVRGEQRECLLVPAPQDWAWRNRNPSWPLTAAGWFFFGTALTETSRLSGMDPLATELISYVVGFGLVAIGITVIWQTPSLESASGLNAKSGLLGRWAATFLVVGLWLIWVAGAVHLFWSLAIGLLTPISLRFVRTLTGYLFVDERGQADDQELSTSMVLMDTLTRALLIGLALWVLARVWGIGFPQLATSDDAIFRLTRVCVIVLAILFSFDALWQFARLAIDTKIARVDKAGSAGAEVNAKQARLRTLLPVARNFAMVICATLAVLMTLSTLGVEIGPLIASAGVVGLAVGFGAQTLVKDIISGVFYLLDDAFRVGEYIQSGNYSGTVESFSLRSVRLRHQNGPVFTVPFSALGAVQNSSRDYAIDKLLVTVAYDTDLEKARKLIDRIGQQMMEDPELAPMIIEPLKMNAVGEFGAYGIQLKLKATTKPGFQSMVRKRAYPLMKRAFDDHGIEFAHPTVKVAEGDPKAKAAGLQQVLNANPMQPG
ncbi:mechanosensitive ion channel family protein [Ensifer sp. B1-9]|uniref:mechanosensitive ion channel family protein n=1 Tax=Ensifer sp. B1-9 TaxID=3141455 RepID=UPI003D25750F